MSNVRFLYTHKFDTGTITSSSEASSSLADDNVVHDFVSKQWRTTADTGQWIKFDLTTPGKITMLAIFGHNLSSGATVTIEANATDSWVTPSYSHAMTWNALAMVEFLDQTYRWWRITIEDNGNDDGYIEIGRICAGEYYEPGVNISQELQKKIVDPSFYQESEGRQGYAIDKTPYRTFDVQFTGISRTQQGELETMFRAVKTTGYLALALDPDNYPEADTIYCRMTTPLAHALGALGYGDVSISFEEMVS